MLHPVRIYGVWDEGVVLDNHMLKSVFVGYDENGKEKFDNTRTELGELLYKFKYQNNTEVLSEIMEIITDILDRWILVIDDLYSTGATLNETCKVLKNDKNVKKIYCLAMTKTKG